MSLFRLRCSFLAGRTAEHARQVALGVDRDKDPDPGGEVGLGSRLPALAGDRRRHRRLPRYARQGRGWGPQNLGGHQLQ